MFENGNTRKGKALPKVSMKGKLVMIRERCVFSITRAQFRCNFNEVFTSSGTIPVIMTDRPMYDRDTGGTGFDHSSSSNIFR